MPIIIGVFIALTSTFCSYVAVDSGAAGKAQTYLEDQVTPNLDQMRQESAGIIQQENAIQGEYDDQQKRDLK